MYARSESRLVILAQIHTGVEARDLVAVPIEHQSFVRLEPFREAALAGLAPARVIDLGIDVGIEAVLLGRIEVPRSGWLVFDKTDFHQRFDALESVFPRHD